MTRCGEISSEGRCFVVDAKAQDEGSVHRLEPARFSFRHLPGRSDCRGLSCFTGPYPDTPCTIGVVSGVKVGKYSIHGVSGIFQSHEGIPTNFTRSLKTPAPF